MVSYYYLLGICSARIFLHISLQNYAALIPVLQKEWQISNAAAGSVISAFHTGFLISLVGLSILTDWVSTKKVFLYSCLSFAIASLLFALFAASYASALLLRGLMGLALGGTYTPGLKLISEIFEASWRGRAMGLFIAAGSFGHAGSLALTGWIIAHFNWQMAFLITSLIPFLGVLIPFIILRRMEDRRPQPTAREFKKELFANKPALLLIAGYSAHAWELEGMRAWTPAFLIACYLALGSTKEHALQGGSYFSSLLYIMGVFSTMIAGYLSDRLGRTTIIIFMMLLSIFCSFVLGWLIGSPMGWVMTIGLLYGFAVIAESPVFSSGLTEVVSPNYLGTALGFRSLVGFGIAALVPTVFGLILDLTNPGLIEKRFTYIPVWGWAFSSLGVVALIGPWAMLQLRSLPESTLMAGGKK
ncbi:MAG: MFS transporter [Thermodesulfobacteriota bacterium]